jgi:molybdopterin molybdotransferase
LIPDGCEAVIRSEDATEVERPEVGGGISSGIESLRSPRAGLNIRRVGEEAELGELLVGAGTTLNPVHLALAASGGIDAVAVRPRPRVAVILSGDEVVDSGIPGPGQVRDSFGLQFPALFGLLGSEVISVARVGDRLPDLSSALRSEAARSADLVVTTGGTGGSRVDLLRAALGELDSEVLVNGLAIRPGAPTLLVRRAGGGPLIGLPGNPLAAILGLLTLGPPILAGLIGDALPRTARVRIAAPIEGKPRLRLLPYRLHAGRASVTAWQGSAMLRGLADADGVLLCPPEGAQPGMELEALPLPWLGSADRWAAGPIEP